MAPFNCSTVVSEDACIVRPVGYLDEIAGKALRGSFSSPLQKGIRRFVLNVEGTPVINSQGIAQLLELVEEVVCDRKGTLSFVGVSALYLDVFRTVGILKLIKAFPDEATALKR